MKDLGSLWVLLYAGEGGASAEDRAHAKITPGAGYDVFTWSNERLFWAYPAMSSALENARRSTRNDPMMSYDEDEYLFLYYFFHASIGLWRKERGAAYPNARYYWRIEPDVVFTAPISRLVAQFDAFPVDLLLPAYASRATDPAYAMWTKNVGFQDRFDELPPNQQVWSRL